MKPRLLFATHFLPFPEYSGAASRTHNLIHELDCGFHVRVLPLFRRPQHATAEVAANAVRAMRERGLDVADAVPVPSDWSGPRRALVHPRSALTGTPFGIVRLASETFRRRLRAELEQPTALIHLDTLDLARFVRGVTDVPIVCNHHDVESPTLHRRTQNARRFAMRGYLRQQAAAYERYERTHAPTFALNIVCSAKEKRHLERIAPGARVEVVSNGVDTAYFAPSDEAPSNRNIMFVGGLDLEPNLDGITFFLEAVWPELLRRVPDCTLTVVGQAPERAVAALRHHPNTTFEGRVEDVRPYMARAGCVIVPLRLGGATRLKILHAWGMAKAIVSTAVGAEGLDAHDGENILLRDEPVAYAEAIRTVLDDPALRADLGARGRETAEATYSTTAIGRHARTLYQALL